MGETFCWSVVGQTDETRQTFRCCYQDRTYIDANLNRQRWKTVGEASIGGEVSWRDKRFFWRKRSQKTEPFKTSYPYCGNCESEGAIGASRTILWCTRPHDLAKETSHHPTNFSDLTLDLKEKDCEGLTLKRLRDICYCRREKFTSLEYLIL